MEIGLNFVMDVPFGEFLEDPMSLLDIEALIADSVWTKQDIGWNAADKTLTVIANRDYINALDSNRNFKFETEYSFAVGLARGSTFPPT